MDLMDCYNLADYCFQVGNYMIGISPKFGLEEKIFLGLSSVIATMWGGIAYWDHFRPSKIRERKEFERRLSEVLTLEEKL